MVDRPQHGPATVCNAPSEPDAKACPPVATFCNSARACPTGAFGEAVPPNDAPTNSPDPVGERAAHVVSDFASNQSLSQVIGSLAAGIHHLIGFGACAPANGYANFYDATFSGVIASVQLAGCGVSNGPRTTWQIFAGAANPADGNSLVEFVFNTNGLPAESVAIEQVYVVDASQVPGTAPRTRHARTSRPWPRRPSTYAQAQAVIGNT